MSIKLLDIEELAAWTGISKATLWRLKKAGKIPFLQPGGKGHAVRFPADAVEQAVNNIVPENEPAGGGRLSGPRPNWMQA